MFGHDDKQQVNPELVPDASLTHNDPGSTVTPVDDTAGDYLTTDNSSTPMPPAHDLPDVGGTAAPAPTGGASTNELLSIKQQALQALSPLVGHLEQSPEEKFRTTMMMIQASDNSELVGLAYETAKQIPDEKARAQALLDIVNEINYFTQHNNQ